MSYICGIPKWRGSRHFGKITGQYSRPQFHLPPLGSLGSWRTSRHLLTKVGTSKRGGKQWQTTPKNVPKMQRTRAMPVAWLSSGLCPNRPKGWILIIIIIIIIIIVIYSSTTGKEYCSLAYCRKVAMDTFFLLLAGIRCLLSEVEKTVFFGSN